MSIALESSNISGSKGEIEPSGFARASSSNFESPSATGNECSTSSSPTTSSLSSSIGKNSDLSEGASSDGEENEVQSAFDGAMDALHEALPIRRGISKFYNGKSKSFTSLDEASASPSIKEIAKPENAYTRRRRNLLSFNHIWEKNRSFPHLSNAAGGIAKRTVSSSRSTLALAVAMNSSESLSSTSEDSNSRSSPDLPPLHPHSRASYNNLASLPSPSPRQKFSPWWSFSSADLQQCNIGTTINSNCFLECGKNDH